MIDATLTEGASHAAGTLLAVSVLILIVLMIRRPVSRQFGAGVAYALWAIPVLRILLPPLNVPVSLLNLDLAALRPAPPPGEAAVPAIPEASGETGAAAAWEAADAGFAAATEISMQASPWTDGWLLVGLGALAVIWAAGALMVAARSLMAHASFMQTVDREAMPVSPRITAMVAQIAAQTGLRRPPRIASSLISRGPFVTGLLRPIIVMPAWFEDDFSPAEARAALAHELMHVKRGDLWALQISELCVAAMWFNPLAYVARDAFRTDQEAACDADVLARCQTSPHAYGSTLVKAARLHLPEPVLAGSRLPLTHALKERLTRMTYPAPSAGRRMIGFGAALLFGVSTLAITASVATAGEPDAQKGREIRIETGNLMMSEIASDRQIVMLSDPMAKVLPDPPEPPEVDALQREIDADMDRLTGPEVMGPILEWHESGEWEELAALGEKIGALYDEDVEEVSDGEGGVKIIRKIRFNGRNISEAERDALVAQLEAKAAALEASIEGREAEMEAHEARIDAEREMLEQRIEAKAAEIERIVEARYGGPDFEARVDAQAALIEDLVGACESADLGKGETRIIERSDADGDVFRVACVKGDRTQLKSESALATVGNHPGITEAEKAAFRAAARGERFESLYVYSSHGESSDAPMPPLAPLAPLPPAPADALAPLAPVSPLPPVSPVEPVAPLDALDGDLCTGDADVPASGDTDCP